MRLDQVTLVVGVATAALATGCAGAVRRDGGRPVTTTPPQAAAPRYPLRVERLAEADVAARERAFRARNPEPWTEVQIDPYGGMLLGAILAEPTPGAFPARPTYDDDAVMRARWAPFLARNADVLGLDAPGMEPPRDAYRGVEHLQRWGAHVLGVASVHWHDVSYSDGRWSPARLIVGGHGWPVVPTVPVEQTDDALAARWVGARGTRVVTFRRVVQPCDPPGGQRHACGDRSPVAVPAERRAPYALTREDVVFSLRTVCRYVVPEEGAMELRIVTHPMLRLHPLPMDHDAHAPSTAGFVPGADQPTPPHRVDVVTGEDLSAGRCDP